MSEYSQLFSFLQLHLLSPFELLVQPMEGLVMADDQHHPIVMHSPDVPIGMSDELSARVMRRLRPIEEIFEACGLEEDT